LYVHIKVERNIAQLGNISHHEWETLHNIISEWICLLLFSVVSGLIAETCAYYLLNCFFLQLLAKMSEWWMPENIFTLIEDS
jgi:hypothetical protein